MHLIVLIINFTVLWISWFILRIELIFNLLDTHKHNTGKLWELIDTLFILIMLMIYGTVNHYNNSGKQHESFLKIKTRISILSIHSAASYMNSKEVYYMKRRKIILSHIIYTYTYINIFKYTYTYSMLLIIVRIKIYIHQMNK